MSDLQLSTLQHEWITLQTQFDSYEKCSLGIKLTSVITSVVLVFGLHASYWSLVVVGILWLQDGIWKTFQNRIGLRLETVEKHIRMTSVEELSIESNLGMQFNLAWADARPGTIGLIMEYLKSAMKPTVAYPHIVLITFASLHMFIG